MTRRELLQNCHSVMCPLQGGDVSFKDGLFLVDQITSVLCQKFKVMEVVAVHLQEG